MSEIVSNTSPLRYLHQAMLLTLETPDSIVLLDGGLARRTAEALKLRFSGTLGILLDAKRAGLVSEIGPLIHQLQGLADSRAEDVTKTLEQREQQWARLRCPPVEPQRDEERKKENTETDRYTVERGLCTKC